MLASSFCFALPQAFAQAVEAESTANTSVLHREQTAARLLYASMNQLLHSDPFTAKLRQTVQVAGERLVGVGQYEHAGKGSGRYRYELKIPTEGGNGTLLQTNDGRLAWTSRRLGEEAIVERVALGRLASESTMYRLAAHHRVGGLFELLDRIGQDYALQAVDGRLHDKPVIILQGPLRANARDRILETLEATTLPQYIPNRIRVAVGRSSLPKWMVERVEYLHESSSEKPEQVLGILEIYDLAFSRSIDATRFQFDAEHMDVEIHDITDRYFDPSANLARRSVTPLR